MRLVQVAGIADIDEARLTMRLGVDWLGFPMRLDVHEPDLTDEAAREVIRAIHPPHRAALITYQESAADIAALAKRLSTSVIQLHGGGSVPELQRLREMCPGVIIVKSIVVHPGMTFAACERTLNEVAPHVDAFITDTFDPATGASGATGKTHDWTISREVVRHSPRPVILAGGLTPENVGEAVRFVRPAGVDVHSGVEDRNGRKNAERVRTFIDEAKKALTALSTDGQRPEDSL